MRKTGRPPTESESPMADIVLFHHVHGLTEGLIDFADVLRQDGHTVHTPDLFDGRTFTRIEDGIGFSRGLDSATVDRRIDELMTALPDRLVYAGFSWGVMHAQRLAQTRAGARGALLFDACLPITGDWAVGPWPVAVPLQIHGMDHDEFFALEGDLDAAREIVAAVGPDVAQLFTYPGDAHLFLDSSLPSYDPEAAALATERARRFLTRIG